MGYRVSGAISDKSSKEPLAEATVQVEARITVTDREGHYSITEELPIAGHMFIKVSKAGYETYTGIVVVEEGDHITCNLELEPWPAQ